MNLVAIELKNLVDGPWRTSEDILTDPVSPPTHTYTDVKRNIARSLRTQGQLAPIHVRAYPFQVDKYEILDGHVVVSAAREEGFTTLFAVVHDLLSDAEAEKLYIHFNLNRASRYHARFMRRLQKLYSGVDIASAVGELSLLTVWEDWRLQAYLELNERSLSWLTFSFAAEEQAGEGQGSIFDDAEDTRRVADTE